MSQKLNNCQKFMREFGPCLAVFDIVDGEEEFDILIEAFKKINTFLPVAIEKDGLGELIKLLPFIASIFITTTNFIAKDDVFVRNVDKDVMHAFKAEYMLAREWTKDLLVTNSCHKCEDEYIKQAMEEIREEDLSLMGVD